LENVEKTQSLRLHTLAKIDDQPWRDGRSRVGPTTDKQFERSVFDASKPAHRNACNGIRLRSQPPLLSISLFARNCMEKGPISICTGRMKPRATQKSRAWTSLCRWTHLRCGQIRIGPKPDFRNRLLLRDGERAFSREFEACEERAGDGCACADGPVRVVQGDRWQEGGELSASGVRRQEFGDPGHCIRHAPEVGTVGALTGVAAAASVDQR